MHLQGLADGDAQLLEYAGLLHDIGHNIGHLKHPKHGYQLIMSGDLPGFAEEERTVLANLVRYHRGAKPRPSHGAFAALAPRIRLKIKRLTAILRIAEGLDRSHFSLLDEVRYEIAQREKIQFQLRTAAAGIDFELDLHSAKRRAGYFEEIFGVETCFTVKTTRPGPAASVVRGDFVTEIHQVVRSTGLLKVRQDGSYESRRPIAYNCIATRLRKWLGTGIPEAF